MPNLLTRVPFFTGLPESELDRLTSEMEVVNLEIRRDLVQ